MDNLKIIKDQDGNEHVIIDRGNNEYVSMLKSDYDTQQAEHFAEIVADEISTK